MSDATLTTNLFFSKSFIGEEEYQNLKPELSLAMDQLMNRSGVDAQYSDWLTWASDFDKSELERIQTTAKKIQDQSKVLVVIGIGGSYLGSRAAIEFVNGIINKDNQKTKILFAGQSISPTYMQQIIDEIGDDDFSLNIISKSGTTTEPAIAFRILKKKLIDKYGESVANKRIYATTDSKKGALRQLADAQKYESFEVPDGIGGRYSVLTAVGLLPIAVSGIDVIDLLNGAKDAQGKYLTKEIENNDAVEYAAYRMLNFKKGKAIEIFGSFEPDLTYFGEWLKQLAGESEGKQQTGLFPATVNYSTDLHSLGQYVQEGTRNIFETIIDVSQSKFDFDVPKEDENLDGLGYLENKSLSEINHTALVGVLAAHQQGEVPSIIIQIKDQSAYSLGYLIYFFELAIAISGYVNGINPFNQPGVEAYKSNMFALLNKPGYEEQSKQIRSTLSSFENPEN